MDISTRAIPEQANKYPGQLSATAAARRDRAGVCMNPKVMLFDEPTLHSTLKWSRKCWTPWWRSQTRA